MITTISKHLATELLPSRPEDGHKGTFGHVFVLAGSRRYPGAMRLAGEAACRSGVGLVTVGIPQSIQSVAATTLLECMALDLPETEDGGLSQEAIAPAMAFAAGKDSLVLGPGLAGHRETTELVRAVVTDCSPPLVIDADGLNHLALDFGSLAWRKDRATILTPHPGEMARLAGVSTAEVQADREGVATRFAATHGVVVVLKGFETLVAHPDGRLAINTTGNNGMATGGTGDILAGLLGGLLAQGVSAWDSAQLGVWLHGAAGDAAAKKYTARAMIARDVITCLPDAFAALERG